MSSLPTVVADAIVHMSSDLMMGWMVSLPPVRVLES